MQNPNTAVESYRQYTRGDALRDGLLIDLTDSPQAPRAKLRLPTAITKAAWDRYIEYPVGPFAKFRVWDILWMASLAIRQSDHHRQVSYFRIPLRDLEGARLPTSASLKAVYGSDEQGGRVVTIMLPEE